ncbi:MAG: hypothetical protein WA183_04075, partial [Chthoniobacterales bacterium]
EVQAWKQAKKLFFTPATDFCRTVMKLSHKFILISSAVGLIVSNTGWAATGLSPVTTNLTLWLEADQGLASNGSTWADQSGLGNNATALPTGNPTVVPGVYNGLPAVEFNGQAMSFAAPVITTQQFTIVVLAIDKTNRHSSNTGSREGSSAAMPQPKLVGIRTLWVLVKTEDAKPIRTSTRCYTDKGTAAPA